jgi:hypothetical protein
VKAVTVPNCCMCRVCSVDGFTKWNCIRSVAADSSISYGPVIVLLFMSSLTWIVARIYNMKSLVSLTVDV